MILIRFSWRTLRFRCNRPDADLINKVLLESFQDSLITQGLCFVTVELFRILTQN